MAVPRSPFERLDDMKQHQAELQAIDRRIRMQEAERLYRRSQRVLWSFVGAVVLSTLAILAKAGGVW